MSVSIRVEQIIYGARRSEQTELRVMIGLDQRGVKASREKRGRLERSKNITERERRAVPKREKKSVVRRLELRVRKVVCNRADQAL